MVNFQEVDSTLAACSLNANARRPMLSILVHDDPDASFVVVPVLPRGMMFTLGYQL